MSTLLEAQTSPAGSASTANKAPVAVRGIVKKFQQGDSTVEALRQVSFAVEQGKFVAIMGASGSGKSTLMHVVAGLTTPNAGTVEIEGVDLSTLSDAALTRFRRRRIGLVFQAFNLIPSLSAEDNITLPLLSDGKPKDMQQRLDTLLARLGLTSRRKHRPDALSGGEQQRVAIARALITDPALVLADEPTGSLDSVSGQGICKLLRELCQEQKRTIVVVTHEPAVAIWAEKVVIMKDGQIVNETDTAPFGNALALATHYQSIASAPVK
ncbi:ABC transporter ATP-binding protein [Anatilimnocola floriformis]|uniref:ABC transporter ATP-binding protein n=1 Tax=Anatilimnocola floriformis TaxID=2948575 RepID=UPI0020C2955A|nr:ABC transporter ATP-binding protein [Anatilimnocola floriformis]